MGRIHESIFVYTKSDVYTWNMQYTPYDQKYIESHYNNIEPGTGRRFRWDNLTAPGGAAKGNPSYEFLGVKRFWRYYLDEMPGVPVQDVWTDINPINSQAVEAVGYATQKPEALLERILKISSNESDLVLDCFCGSGTTAVVGEKLGRHWIACDLSRFAIHTTRKRLLSNTNVRPFVVQNLGKYERQQWAGAQFGADPLHRPSGGPLPCYAVEEKRRRGSDLTSNSSSDLRTPRRFTATPGCMASEPGA